MSADIIEMADHRHVPSEPAFYNSDHKAEIKSFTPRIAMCSICSSSTHRAHRCPKRPRTAAARDYIQTD